MVVEIVSQNVQKFKNNRKDHVDILEINSFVEAVIPNILIGIHIYKFQSTSTWPNSFIIPSWTIIL